MNSSERLLHAAAADPDAVLELLSTQSKSEIDAVLQVLPQNQHEESAMVLFRLIFGQPVDGQRLSPTIFLSTAPRRRQAVDMIMNFVIKKKLHHKWVNEICMAYMVFIDELRKCALESVEKEIYQVIESILETLGSTLQMPLTDVTNFQSMLDCVPYLISLVHESENMAKLIDKLLELPWSACTLHLVLGFAKDCPFFTKDHHSMLQNLVTQSIDQLSVQLSFGYWNDCIQGCFELSEKYKDVQWLQICRQILSHIPYTLEKDLDYLFQTIFQHSPEYVNRFHLALSESEPTEKDITLLLHSIHASQPLFKLAIQNNDSVHAQLQNMLLNFFLSQEFISIDLRLHQAAHWKALLLLDLAITWLPDTLQVSMYLLLVVFDKIPELRLDVTNLLLNSIEHNNSLIVIKTLVQERSELFSRFTPQFQERITHLFPLSVSKCTALIDSLLPFVTLVPFYSFLMVFLRKHLVSPIEAHQKACITIWCDILTKVTVTSRQREDIISCFHDVLKMPNIPVQQHLLLLLPNVLPLAQIPLGTLLPLQTAIKQRLDAFATLTPDSLQLSKAITDEDQAEIFTLCWSVLQSFGAESFEHISCLRQQLSLAISESHCVSYIQDGNPISKVARAALYASFCDVAASDNAILLRCNLNRIQGHLQKQMLLPALSSTCCLQRTMLALTDLEKQCNTLTLTEIAEVLAVTSSLYPELVQGAQKIPIQHKDFGLSTKCHLKVLKVYKIGDIMSGIIRLWMALAKANALFTWDSFLSHWNINEWDPLLAAFNQQLEQLVDGTSNTTLALMIAELIRVIQSQLSRSRQREVSDTIYQMMCQNAVASPNLLRILLAIALTDPPIERIAAVLSESQGLGNIQAEHKNYKRLRPAVTHPMLISEATKSTAYTSAMKQLDYELQQWYQQFSAAETPSSPWAIISALLHEAFEVPDLSWKSVSGVIDSLLKIGKCVLPAIYGDELILTIIQDIVYLFLRLLKAWQQGTSMTIDLTTKMDVFLLEATSALTTVLKKKHGLGMKEREAVETMTRCIMEHMEAMADVTKKQTKKLRQQAQELRVATKKRRNHRLRSRHEYIDECLREEGGDDAFADLEDFIA
ncbi:hypothetical protein THRCLA_09015 [Thraustotheca clavata]|uniref:Uncharacterized protein n=1 Tax=Thraustotheca clavata TaxID=74557 RepID=A0A1V9Z0D6_9STRA|nr:hypothetical protein THRCLA_09015 [Thraustotheca clavata]